jgi:hypothetical protein
VSGPLSIGVIRVKLQRRALPDLRSIAASITNGIARPGKMCNCEVAYHLAAIDKPGQQLDRVTPKS